MKNLEGVGTALGAAKSIDVDILRIQDFGQWAMAVAICRDLHAKAASILHVAFVASFTIDHASGMDHTFSAGS